MNLFFSETPQLPSSRPDRDILRFVKPENRGIRKDFIKVSVFNFPRTYDDSIKMDETRVCSTRDEPIVEKHEQRPR